MEEQRRHAARRVLRGAAPARHGLALHRRHHDGGRGDVALLDLRFQSDMGILLAFMFLVNAFGAILFLRRRWRPSWSVTAARSAPRRRPLPIRRTFTMTKKPLVALAAVLLAARAFAADPLPSWNDTAPKQAIVEFVETSDEDRARRTSCRRRSASRPSTTTARCGPSSRCTSSSLFVVDRVKALAPQHPEWKTTGAVRLAAEGRPEGRRWPAARRGSLEMMAATHAGMTTEEFDATVKDWIATREASEDAAGPSPRWSTSRCSNCSPTCARTASRRSSSPAAASSSCVRGRSASMAFRPSRSSAAAASSSSSCATASRCIVKLPELDPHRRQGRQAGRHPAAHRSPPDRGVRQLRRRPADAAVDGRRQRRRASASTCITPTPQREWAYDRESHIGKLDKGLDEAHAKGWTVVSMKDDWNRIYP